MTAMRPRRLFAAALPVLAALSAVEIQADSLAVDLLREMVSQRTSAAHPESTARLAESLAARLVREGFPAADVEVVRAGPIANLVARYRGDGSQRPLLTMAHLDVVDAEPADWSSNPFELTEIDGHYQGRGVLDNKAGAAALVANFIRLRREGYRPARDLIVVLTGDEETGMTGIAHLVRERRELIDAELALNTDAGGIQLDAHGRAVSAGVQLSEKLYQTFEFTVTNPGGHSSRPRPDNAIYQLARALGRLEDYAFPASVNPVVRGTLLAQAQTAAPERAALLRRAAAEPPDMAAVERLSKEDPSLNASFRTTCVATMLHAGIAENALPNLARATVNCRLLPGDAPRDVLATLRAVVADPAVRVAPVGAEREPSPASPARQDVLEVVRRLIGEFHGPGVPLAPQQSTGATDGRWVRQAGIPVYGFSGIATRPEDARAHGIDERVPVESFVKSVALWYSLLKEFGGGR